MVFIKQLRMQNFRCFKDVWIEGLSRVNVFAGRNWSGKSTIIDAIAVALTGSCRGADTGRALGELRSTGSRRRWGVTLNYLDGDSQQQGLQRSEGEGPRSDAQMEISSTIGCGPDRVRACVYSSEFLDLPRKDQQQLFLQLAEPGAVDVPMPLREAMKPHVGDPGPTMSLQDIDTAYDQVYAARRDVGRQQREHGDGPGDAEPPEGLETLAGKTADDVGAIYRSMRDKVESLRGELEQARATLTGLTEAPDRAKRRLADVEQELAQLERDKIDPKQIRADVQAVAKELSEATQAATDRRKKRDEVADQIGQVQGEHDLAERYLRDAGGELERCLMCDTKLTGAKLKKIREGLTERKAMHKRKLQELRMQMEQVAGNPYADKIEELEQRIRDLSAKEECHNDQVVRGQELEQAKIGAENEIAASDQSQERIDQQNDVIQSLEERIEQGQQRMAAVQEFGLLVGAVESVRETRKALDIAHEELDDLVKALGPGGIRKQMSEGSDVGAFQLAVADRLAQFEFDQVDFGPLLRLEDDVHVFGRPARMLSRSQRLVFGVAFQIAVAQATGLGFICVDDLECLDPDVAGKATKMIASAGVQAFMFKVLNDEDKFVHTATAVNKGDGPHRMYIVESGSVVAPGEASAA